MPALTPSAREILGPGSPLSRALSGYEAREGQVAMADAVAEALRAELPLFVEAGTGTGKTLAYLVPAVLSGMKVVVSTATRALQDQIWQKDLPLVREVLAAHGVVVDAALMKGLPNYLCKRRWDETRQASVAGLAEVTTWLAKTESGDLNELDMPEDAPVRIAIASSSETRIGAGCKYFEECFVTRMKQTAESARILIVNHHLFCADLALRHLRAYASVIPAYDAVIFDEAHQLEDIATMFFGSRMGLARIEALVRDARRTVRASREAVPLLMEAIDRVERTAERFFGKLEMPAVSSRAPTSTGGRRMLGPDDVTGEQRVALADLDQALDVLDRTAATAGDLGIAQASKRAADLRAALADIMTSTADEDHAPSHVAWVEPSARGVVLGKSVVDVAPELSAALFGRTGAIVATSATLATAGPQTEPSFHFARARLGAPDTTRGLVIPSPFDFPNAAGLYIPRDLPDPSDTDWEAAAAGRVGALVSVTGGGCFVLCTSTRVMFGMNERLRMAGIATLVQGESSKAALLDRFREAGNAVLVATMSFWEGVDVPGPALRLVVMDKIPFPVPSDPVYAARAAIIERDGGNPFMQYAVPQAGILLKQGFGRLIRSQSDAGIVALLDRRALTKAYGTALLASLPRARQLRSLEDVVTFWASVTERRVRATPRSQDE